MFIFPTCLCATTRYTTVPASFLLPCSVFFSQPAPIREVTIASVPLHWQDFNPRIYLSESDFMAITRNGALCRPGGTIGPAEFEMVSDPHIV